MHKNIARNIIMSPDKLTISIEPKEIEIEPTIGVKTISVNILITELILPIIQTPKDRRETSHSQYNKDHHWNCERFHIYWRIDQRILLQSRGASFVNPEETRQLEALLEELRKRKIEFHITEIDYQTTFLTNQKEKIINELKKTKIQRPPEINDTGLSIDELMQLPAERGLTYYSYGRNPFLPETSGFKSSVYSLNLYNKNIQLRQQTAEQYQTSKREFYKRYGNQKDMLRLEHSYTRKSKTLNRINDEIQQTLKIPNKSLSDLFNETDKYRYTKKFLTLIINGEKIK